MARRSDHSPLELRALLIDCGHSQMAEKGFARFSARESARRAGYSVGTIYNVFGSLEAYLYAVNSLTFVYWSECLETALVSEGNGGDTRIQALVNAYFDFAEENSHCWRAIYEHHHGTDLDVSIESAEQRGRVLNIVDREVTLWLGREPCVKSRRVARSLVAIVHGHCALYLTGSLALMDIVDARMLTLERVMEILLILKSSES